MTKRNEGKAAVFAYGSAVPEMRPISELLAEAAALGVSLQPRPRVVMFNGEDIGDLVPEPESDETIWNRFNAKGKGNGAVRA